VVALRPPAVDLVTAHEHRGFGSAPGDDAQRSSAEPIDGLTLMLHTPICFAVLRVEHGNRTPAALCALMLTRGWHFGGFRSIPMWPWSSRVAQRHPRGDSPRRSTRATQIIDASHVLERLDEAESFCLDPYPVRVVGVRVA